VSAAAAVREAPRPPSAVRAGLIARAVRIAGCVHPAALCSLPSPLLYNNNDLLAGGRAGLPLVREEVAGQSSSAPEIY